MKDGEPCTSRGVSTVLEGVTPRPRTKGSMAWRFLPYRDAFMEGFWMQLKTAKREKQQHLTEFFLEWIWITPEKTLELENLRYWAADYCLPFV